MAGFVSMVDFDFSVRLSTSVMTVKAGQSISVPVMLGTLKGDQRPITLTTSDWKSAGLSAQVVPSTVPSTGGAMLNITVPAGTPPGSYLFTVRGAAEGTFKTSNAALTVVVEPENAQKDGQDHPEPGHEQGGPEMGADPAVVPPPGRAKRGILARSAKKAPPRPATAGQRVAFVIIMIVMVFVLVYYFSSTFRSGSTGSASGMSGTYAGTSTFCINSVMGNAPECGTSNCSIQIDASGNVLGPVLFGKITSGSFSGEADAGNGSTFPMTGTFSNGTLTAKYSSSSVNWTITVRK